MKSETLVFAPGIGASLWQNLQRGQFADVEAAGRTGTSRPDVIGCRLTVEHCPSCPAENGPPAVYLTLKDLAEAGTAPGVGFAKSRNIARLHTLVDHVALRPQEIGALAGAFPSLRTSIEAQPHLYAEVQSAVRQLRRERQAVLSEWQKPLAQVEPVEPGEAGRILKGNNILKQTVIGIGSGLGGFALALGVPAIFMSMNPKPPDWVAIVAIVWMFGWMILNLLWVMFYGNYLTARFMLRQTQRAFARRAEVAVNMNNPDLWFVDIIPPKNWGKMTLENATDIGFLELDKSRRELIFEGDRERYWIPVESILEVKHEFWSEPVQHHFQSKPTQHHLTVVRAMTPDGPWETWFYRRQVRFRMRTAKRRLADAQELEEKIQALMEPAT
jgi:hypothetical protein